MVSCCVGHRSRSGKHTLIPDCCDSKSRWVHFKASRSRQWPWWDRRRYLKRCLSNAEATDQCTRECSCYLSGRQQSDQIAARGVKYLILAKLTRMQTIVSSWTTLTIGCVLWPAIILFAYRSGHDLITNIISCLILPKITVVHILEKMANSSSSPVLSAIDYTHLSS